MTSRDGLGRSDADDLLAGFSEAANPDEPQPLLRRGFLLDLSGPFFTACADLCRPFFVVFSTAVPVFFEACFVS